ncbi:integrase [Enterococcus villorum]|uniref:Integrase n=1 Tax=Enterococcus villorum TaxID=112904 RepID=A0A1V8YJU3_9ENTE|nr:site-specific integrase [Enterococcus villorum]OQO71154.1 integrase [Enterococcus villorum]OQO72862.1 integrase [Enterococcus villorum]
MKSKKTQLFHKYFEEWIELYKVGSIRSITLEKYYMSSQWVAKLAPNMRICDLNRRSYQTLLNAYAKEHEKQTTMDFHHQIKGAILDAVDEGLLDQNPTRKVIIKGKTPKEKKPKFLNQHEIQLLLRELDLKQELNWDWFILLIAKTGLRFSEALALTPNDFDFYHQKILVTKTWNYRNSIGDFQPTKNASSVRKIQIDWQLAMQFSQLIKNLEPNKPIFVTKRVFNSTINNRLKILCTNAKIPVITVHSLRHTHASLLLFAGISIASVAKRLGHSSMTTTQETYLHIIQELENQDNDKIMRHLATLV